MLRVGYVGFVYLSSRKSFDSFIKSNQRRKKKNKTLRKKKNTCQSHRPLSCGAFHVMKFNKPIKLFFFHIYLLKVREKHVNEIDGQARLWLETGRDSCLVSRWVPLLHKPPTFQICSPVTMLTVYWWDPVTCSFYTSRFSSCLPCANKPLRRLPK